MPSTDRQKQESQLCECYKFYYNDSDCIKTFVGTTSDVPVTLEIGGEDVVFPPLYLSRGQIQRSADESSDRLTISTNFDSTHIAEFISSAIAETLTVKVFQVFTTETKARYTSEDYIVAFWGESENIDRRDNTVTVSFTGFNERFKEKFPRVLAFKSCPYALYDPFTCKANKEEFTFEGAAVHIQGDRRSVAVVFADVPNDFVDDAFVNGVITFAGDECYSAMINVDVPFVANIADARGFRLYTKIPDSIRAPVQVTVTYGCDRTKDGENGCAKFDNRENFGGSFKYVQLRNLATDKL